MDVDKHFFIAKNCVKMIKDEGIKGFFEFLISNKSSDSFTYDLGSYVDDAKHNTQWRMQYMTWERQRAYDRDEGIQENKIANAKNMLKDNVPAEQVAKWTSLPLEQVLALKAELEQES